jgi:rhamnose utilization protein RhaD (predicted bifunctional aldolase and dehydrogenase)/NAD(P)-dependent dehydrogenase (short-subunit alcohol dehydrogenase family)
MGYDASSTSIDEVNALVTASRTIGSDPSLVLHGGGNTSVKAPWVDITGRTIEALYVKGSGWDLGTIERPGFTPLPLARLHELLELKTLSDPDMMRELSAARLDPSAPQPSVESLLHAFLPHRAVLHSHADVILTLTNLDDGETHVRAAFGSSVIVVPYVMPGFDLAREVRATWARDATADTIGMVLMNHGVFAFGDSCTQALERHKSLIAAAHSHLANVPAATRTAAQGAPCRCAVELATLRRQMSALAGKPLIVTRHSDDATMAFVQRYDLADIATRGPLTPDHVIRTKRVPLVGRDLEGYAADYRAYFNAHANRARTPITMLDPAPRVVLDAAFGMLTAGPTAKDAAIAADVYRHTMQVIETCEDRLGGWRPLPAQHLFDVEYWDLEQAKLRLAGAPAPLAGQIAVVTGAASGIGRACAAALLKAGAAVVGFDRSTDVTSAFATPAWLGIAIDVTNEEHHAAAIEQVIDRFGGIDIAVLAAGIFGPSMPIAQLERDAWNTVQSVNVEAIAFGLKALHPFLTLSPVGGRVVLVGSKNVPAPGASAAAYSASKAAMTQLARVAALEWAPDNIRVNVVHPDAVFDTALWSDELLAQRAASYGLTVEQYKRRNLLKMEVTSDIVARGVVQLVGDAFVATTGAQIAIDGGSDRTL